MMDFVAKEEGALAGGAAGPGFVEDAAEVGDAAAEG